MLEYFQKVLRVGLDQEPGTNGVEVRVFGSGFPSRLSRPGFELENLLQDMLPGSCRDQRIAVAEVDAGEAQIQGGLPAGLVEGGDQALGLLQVLGFKACKAPGAVVEGVVNALAPAKQTVAWFHSSDGIELN